MNIDISLNVHLNMYIKYQWQIKLRMSYCIIPQTTNLNSTYPLFKKKYIYIYKNPEIKVHKILMC